MQGVSDAMPAGRAGLRAAVEALAPALDRGLVDEHFARLEAAYFERFGAQEIASHLALAAHASPERPVVVAIRPLADARFEIVFAGYDLFGEFALLAGLMTSAGLDIRSGRAFTFLRAPAPVAMPAGRRARPSPTRILDVFVVAPETGVRFDTDEQAGLVREAEVLIGLVAEGQAAEARDRVESSPGRTGGASVRWRGPRAPTRGRGLRGLRLRAVDAYGRARTGHAGAFSMRSPTVSRCAIVYIQHVEIASVADEARDAFLIATRDGRKIQDPAELARLRVAVALIKQFAHLLPLAPDPARALRSFAQLVDRALAEEGPTLHLLASPEGLRELARLLGASAFLWEDFLRLQAEHLLPVLDSWRRRPLRARAELVSDLGARLRAARSFEEKKRVLNEFKDEEMLVADMRQVVDPQLGLVAFSRAITDLAEAVVEAALAACLAEVARRGGVGVALSSGSPVDRARPRQARGSRDGLRLRHRAPVRVRGR